MQFETDLSIIVDESDEVVPVPSPRIHEGSVRLLARWLLSAARKGPPAADSSPVEGSQNRLDVGPGAKVGSDGP